MAGCYESRSQIWPAGQRLSSPRLVLEQDARVLVDISNKKMQMQSDGEWNTVRSDCSIAYNVAQKLDETESMPGSIGDITQEND